MNFYLILGVILILGSCSNTVSTTTQPIQLQKPYLDLTEIVDQYAKHGDEISAANLRKALAVSTNVFYSTDLLLNDVLKLSPVIEALNQHMPENASLSIKLSLRYTSNNQFNQERLNDIFYDVSLNITTNSWTKIFGNVKEIFLDFSSITECKPNLPYWVPDKMDKMRSLGTLSYSENVIMFNKHYCGSSSTYDRPIGMIYNPNGICAGFLINQIKKSKKVMVFEDLNPLKNLPYTNKTFKQYFEDEIKRHNQISDKIPQFLINIEERLTKSKFSAAWDHEKMKNTVFSVHYNEALEELISHTYQYSLDLIFENVLLFGQPDSNFLHDDIILGNRLTEQFVNRNISAEKNVMQPVVIPSVYSSEPSMSTCRLSLVLNQTGAGNIIMDHYTWQALVRSKTSFETPTTCWDPYRHRNFDIEYMAHHNVHLVFESGIKSVWPVLEPAMNKLLFTYKQVGNATLKSVLIHEKDLFLDGTDSLNNKTTNEPIVTFLKKLTSDNSIGCVVTLTNEKIKEGNLLLGSCEPIFDQVKIIIWILPNDYSLNMGYFSTQLFDIAIFRAAFLKEYPQKEVFIDFGRQVEKSDAENLARFYNMSMIYKSI